MGFGTIRYIGQLSEVSIGELLFSYAVQKENGLLYLRNQKTAKRIYFQKGAAVYVESSLPREYFHRYLIERGHLSPENAIQLLEEARKSKIPAETMLLEAGPLPREEADRVHMLLLCERLIETFGWQEGQFAFFFDRPLPADLVPRELPLEWITYQGIISHYSRDQLKAEMAHHLDETWRLSITPNAVRSQLRLSEEEQTIADKIDGVNKVEDIVFTTPISMRTTLALLLAVHILRLAETPKIEETAETEPLPMELTPDEKNYAQRLIATGPALLNMNPFELLSVGRVFSDTDLRRGYYQLAQRYHQREVIEKYPKSYQALSHRIFEWISLCFEALLEIEKANQDRAFDVYKDIDIEYFDNKEQQIEAETIFLTGMTHFDQMDIEAAIRYFEEAVDVSPNMGEYRTFKALAKLKVAQGDDRKIEEILFDLNRSAAVDSRCYLTFMTLGETHEEQGHREEAFRNYGKALEISIHDKDAKLGQMRTKEPFRLQDQVNAAELEKREAKVENRLKEFIQQSEKANYFEVLGLGDNASPEAVKNSYFKLAKEFHPDRLGRLKDHPLAEEVFGRINTAYSILSSEKKRRVYERSLKVKKDQKRYEKEQEKLEAHKMVAKAKALMNDGRYDQAQDMFEQIDEIRGGCAECKAHIGYIIFRRRGPGDQMGLAQAERYFRESTQIDPNYIEVYLLWGRTYRFMKQYRQAKTYFQKVLDRHEDHVEALREMRLINQRIGDEPDPVKPADGKKGAGDKSEKKGLLGGLFGRKK